MQEDARLCTECDLHKTRTLSVFARGSDEASLMLVGEAPGATEDQCGSPFVGDAGKLLEKALLAMGLNPATDAYICNALKCRPPNNRTPTAEELRKCWPILLAQIQLVKPKVIVALGKTAVAALGLPLSSTWRGQWGLGPYGIPVMQTYHPAYLLRSPDKKKEVGKDLKAVLLKLQS